MPTTPAATLLNTTGVFRVLRYCGVSRASLTADRSAQQRPGWQRGVNGSGGDGLDDRLSDPGQLRLIEHLGKELRDLR